LSAPQTTWYRTSPDMQWVTLTKGTGWNHRCTSREHRAVTPGTFVAQSGTAPAAPDCPVEEKRSRPEVSPTPGLRAGVALLRGHRGGPIDLLVVGNWLPGERSATENPPPGLPQVEPAGPGGDEAVPHARVGGQPRLDRRTLVAAEVVADQ